MDHEAMKKLLKKTPTMKSKPLSQDKKHQLLFNDIGGACYLTHLAAWEYFLLIRKHKYFIPVKDSIVVVGNITDAIRSVALNGVKLDVVNVN